MDKFSKFEKIYKDSFFHLKKEWIDQEPNIEKVWIVYTLGLEGESANWDNAKKLEMIPILSGGKVKREYILKLPYFYKDSPNYILHYYFQVKTAGRIKVSSIFSQLIVSKDIYYVDYVGDIMAVVLHWAPVNWDVPQDTPMEVEGMEHSIKFTIKNFTEYNEDFLNTRFEELKKLPLPHVFKAMVKGIKGNTLNYCFKIFKKGNDSRIITFWDNNKGADWRVEL